jgi:Asp-tRNA(Asn)/Glu-tRNA(Gln) amidotransferase A subunit family amidase
VTIVSLLAFNVGSSSAEGPVLDLEKLDGLTAVEMMEDGELTSVQLVQAYIDRINALNQAGPGLNAVSQLNRDALKDAAELDAMRARGEVLSPAHGLPILLKDLIDVEGMYTSAGNWSLRNSFPETDSGVARKLKENGLVILGKLGLSEFANSFGNQPSGFANLTGQVLNGLDADQNPSGSSSGSGSAGAAALSTLVIGTETSGSIISPSNANGLVGLRPTVGLVPGDGIAPIRASQDTAGPMDRTVADAALTLTSIAGTDAINDAYFDNYWAQGNLDPEDVIPPLPAEIPDYLSALDLKFVKGKRIGWNGTTPQVMEAKQVLEDAGAILVERPVINPGTLPTLSGAGEQHMAIDLYYQRLGANAPIKSLEEEIADNQANPQEALKFGNGSHVNAAAVAWGPETPWATEFSTNLPIRKQIAWSGIDRMMQNDTPSDPTDDFIAILGSVSNGPLAGYPQLAIPMGYDATQRRTLNVQIHGGAYSERDLIGVGYVIEQATRKRLPASMVNPSMYRCADTVPAPPFAERGGCNPDEAEAMALAGAIPELPFDLETESVKELQERMTQGTLTSEALTRAYLARIAVANAAGPAIQAVRDLNTDAVAQAAALDAERQADGPRGPLHGIPVLLDDVIDAQGMATTGGSIALQESMPTRDSRIVTRLKLAGAVILGKTNVSEMNGVFSSTAPEGYSSLGGQVLLPSDTDKTPAGSSGGSAAATSSGMAAMAVGLQTSPDSAQLIAPAGVAGVVGLKPTVGRVSRAGVLPVAKSQDSPGPITQTVYDAALQLQAIAGPDFRDPATTGTPPVPDYIAGLTADALSGKRVAVISSTTAPYPAAVTTIQNLGATTAVVTPGTPSPNPPSIVTREFERDLDAYLATMTGAGADSLSEVIEYNKDNPVEGLKYQQGDLLAAEAVNLSDPATLTGYETDRSTGISANRAVIDSILNNGTPDDSSDDFFVIAVPSGNSLVGIADRAGYPVMTVPAGYGTGSAGRNPIGLTLVAGAFAEDKLLSAGYAFEQATNVRLAPSFTNPSMWRCVELSEFYSPYNCRPGTVDALPPVDPPDPLVPELGLTVPAKTKTVGPRTRQVSYVVRLSNTGDATTGPVEVCAVAPSARARVLGSRCSVLEIPAGRTVARTIQVRIKRPARGKLTLIKVTADGEQVEPVSGTLRLRVKR